MKTGAGPTHLNAAWYAARAASSGVCWGGGIAASRALLLLLLLDPERLHVTLEHGLVAHLLLVVGLLLAESVLLPSLEVGRLLLRHRGEVDRDALTHSRY